MTTTANALPITVLLVEDNPADARLVLEFLREAGMREMTLTHVANLRGAVEHLRRDPFKAIILDLGLPDSQGLATFTRTHEEASDAPILVLTGLQDEEMAVAAVRDGAQDYLVKGQIDGPTLRRAIQYSIERKRAAVMVRDNEARLGAVLRLVRTGGWELDLVTHAAHRTLEHDRIFGYKALLPEWTYEMFLEHVLPEDRGEVDRRFREATAAGARWDFECRIRRADGEVRWIWATGGYERDEAGRDRRMSGIVQDITERKQGEAALRESEERFRQMAEHIQEVFFLAELASGRVLYLNPTFERLWGVSAQAVYQRREVWFEGVHPDDQSALAASLARGRAGENTVESFRVVRPDGTTRWMRARAFPIPESDRLVGLIEDVTELKRAEEQMTQAQKMEAVGRLAGGVAHDFNNLLTVILGEVEMMQLELPPPEQIREALDAVKQAGERAVGLTRQLLAFSRRQLIEPTVFPLGDLVRDTTKMLQRLIGEDLTLVTRVRGVGSVKADRGQVEQVLVNLAVNARDAMPGVGTLTIETQEVALDEGYVREHRYVTPGEYAVLVVSDTGGGMTPEVQSRIFEPFFTTKEQGKGTGLGLATSYGIVKQAGGHITVYSELGHGTTFKVYLPKVAGVAPAATTKSTPLPTGKETILLVEDDTPVRGVAMRVLTGQGYTVLEAANGRDALALLDARREVVHLIMTDVVMPRMGGRELSEEAVKRMPGIKVLFATGYTDDVVLQHRLLENDARLIQKPYTRETLARKVREVLDE